VKALYRKLEAEEAAAFLKEAKSRHTKRTRCIPKANLKNLLKVFL